MRRIVLLAVFSFLAAVTVNLIDKSMFPLILRQDVKMVPNTRIAELLALDHRGFLADVYLIQVSLHSGSLMWQPLKFQFDSEWAYGMMDVITDLDPKYYTAYLFSGMGLIHNFSDATLAKRIIEKGMAVFPDSWELPFWIGYDHYIYLEDMETAGAYLWIASQKPGAPDRFLSLMSSALKKAGDYEKAAMAMKALMDAAPDENLKTVYAKRLVQLENLIGLQGVIDVYQKTLGRYPADLNELVNSGIIRELPQDPFGMTYAWNADQKRVVVNRDAQSDRTGG